MYVCVIFNGSCATPVKEKTTHNFSLKNLQHQRVHWQHRHSQKCLQQHSCSERAGRNLIYPPVNSIASLNYINIGTEFKREKMGTASLMTNFVVQCLEMVLQLHNFVTFIRGSECAIYMCVHVCTFRVISQTCATTEIKSPHIKVFCLSLTLLLNRKLHTK